MKWLKNLFKPKKRKRPRAVSKNFRMDIADKAKLQRLLAGLDKVKGKGKNGKRN
jgi:hypothetical protein